MGIRLLRAERALVRLKRFRDMPRLLHFSPVDSRPQLPNRDLPHSVLIPMHVDLSPPMRTRSQVKCLIPVMRENKIKYFAKSASTKKIIISCMQPFMSLWIQNQSGVPPITSYRLG